MMTESEAAELNNLRRVAAAARALEDFLGKNSGTTADWPVDIRCKDMESADQLTGLLESLKDALLAL